MDAFSDLTHERLGWYVYILRDPASGQPFYVGKGIRDRAFDHAVHARADEEPVELQSAKVRRIREIEAAGGQVRVDVLRHGLSTEKLAYEVEAAAIDLVHALAPGTLLNVVLGHHHAQRGLMSAAELDLLYAAKPAPPLQDPVLLVSLNKLWTPTATADQLYEITRGWWGVAPHRAETVKYVLGVHNGVVRSIYRPLSWRQKQEGDRDWVEGDGKALYGFDGEPAPDMERYLLTSVRRFLRQQWSHRYVVPEDEASD